MQNNIELNQFGEVDNTPNAAKLLLSLRHLDYDNISAINDLVDNSIDANATHIWVNIIAEGKKSIQRIEISDDGVGMNWSTLNEALKLGSETIRNATYDLGYYGMGLITASISMGKQLEVITKAENSDIISAVQDIDEIVERDKFFKIIRPLTPDEIAPIAKSFNDLMGTDQAVCDGLSTPTTFTKVVISKLDRINWILAGSMENELKKRLGQVFRKFIKAGKVSIFVGNELVKPIDPIYDFQPNILTEESIKLDDGDINIVVAELKDNGDEINKEKGLNIPNQGFYVLRNNREILTGESFGLFTKHGDFNTLRIEFSYSGTLDAILNTNFSKQRIKLNQSIEDRVNRICQPFIRQVRSHAKARQKASKVDSEDFSEVEKYITQKAHLLKNPKAEAEVHSTPTPSETKAPKPMVDTDRIRLNITKRQRINIDSLKVRFDTINNLGEKGPLWASDQERDRIIVRWNVDHPFYQQVVVPNADNPDVFNPLAYLIYCFASAELIAKDASDSLEILDNIRYDVGRNLAVLLQ